MLLHGIIVKIMIRSRTYLRAYIVYTIAFLITSPVWHIPLILSLGIILLGSSRTYFQKPTLF